MRKVILWFIKAVIIFVIIFIWVATKEMGVPAIIRSGICLAVFFAVLYYNPNSNENNSESNELDKK